VVSSFVKHEEFSFVAYGVVEGAKLDVTFRTRGFWPPACRGVVEKVYPRFAVLKTKHYRVTIHFTDLLNGTASVELAQGPEKTGNVVWLLEAWERAERPAQKRAAVR
jgi:hypothetical protein